MNTIVEETKCHEQKEKLKLKFSMLTDDDLLFADGLKTEMLGRIRQKLGKTKSQMLRIVSAL